MGRDHTTTLGPGDSAPSFSLDSSIGRPVALDDYRGVSAVLVVFVRGTF
jgi:peroxiredoxin